MRAGPLSDDNVIERLNADFVNTWIIIPQFEEPDQFFENETARDWAAVVAGECSYPVDSMVISPEGQPLSQGEFRTFYRPDAAAKYLGMLQQATKQP